MEYFVRVSVGGRNGFVDHIEASDPTEAAFLACASRGDTIIKHDRPEIAKVRDGLYRIVPHIVRSGEVVHIMDEDVLVTVVPSN